LSHLTPETDQTGGRPQPKEVWLAQPLPSLRWSCLVVLLLAELVGLSLRFDAGALVDETGWWAQLLLRAPLFPRLGIAIVLLMLVLPAARLPEEVGRLSGQLRGPYRWWPLFLLGHLAGFAGLAWLTAQILEGGVRSSPYPGAWALAWLFVAGTTLAFWGAAVLLPALWLSLARRWWRVLAAALALGGATWGLGRLTENLWEPLGRSTLWSVHELLRLVTPDTVYQPADLAVGTSSFWVEIAPACSGYEGIGLICGFLGVYLWCCRRDLRFPHAFLLLPLGTALVWLTNVLRIAALVTIGTWVSSAVALGGFHSQAGWLAFSAVALGLVAVTRYARLFARSPSPPAPESGPSAVAVYVAPFLTILAAALIGRACSDGFDWLYPLRVVAVVLVLWFFRREYARLRWTASWQAVALGVVAFGIWIAWPQTSPPSDRRATLGSDLASLPPGWAAAWLVCRVIGSVFLAPFAEELAFRGYLTRRLVAADFEHVSLRQFSWGPFLVSSALFGSLHEVWLAGTLVGMLYALALYRRGEILDAVLAHVTTNALLTAYVIATGNWSLWS
jgi:exosortase E/protease (VPEID-CTERM system)